MSAACNPSTGKVGTAGSEVQGHPKLSNKVEDCPDFRRLRQRKKEAGETVREWSHLPCGPGDLSSTLELAYRGKRELTPRG